MRNLYGYRLNDQALSVRVGGEQGPHIGEISDLSIADHLDLVSQLTLSENEAIIARPILKEIKDRLTFLNNVGLNYLTLSRSAGTLQVGKVSVFAWQPRLVLTYQVSFIF